MNIEDFPPEILTKILSYLSFEELLIVECVSQYWKDLVFDLPIWRELEITHEFKITNFQSFSEKIGAHASLIKNMTIRKIDELDEITFILRTCVNLEKLRLVMCKIENEALRNIEPLSNLTILSLKNCYLPPHQSGLRCRNIDFSHLTKLKGVLLSDFGLSDENFDSLLLCHNIRHLDIQKIKNVSQRNVIQFLVQNKNILITLGIYAGESYDDDLLKYISECKNVQKVTLIRCENFTDQGLICLNKLSINSLSLWNNDNFSQKALLAVFSCPNWCNLEYLSVAKIKNINEQILEQLARRCPNLGFFGVYRCPQLVTTVNEDFLNKSFPNVQLFYQI